MLWVILGSAPRSFIVLVSLIFARRLSKLAEFKYPLENLVVLPEKRLQRVFWS